MNELFSVLLLALLPAAGNFFGGLLAEIRPISARSLSLALHAAAGVVLAIVGVEIMPQALQAEPAWVMVVALVLGGLFYMLIESWASSRLEQAGSDAGPWFIYLTVAIDLFSDGLMIGAGSSIDLRLGLLLALGQVTADIPEGFATLASFRSRGMGRARRLWLGASFALPVLLGAGLGFGLVRSQPEIVKLALLAFTAGILMTLVVEEIVPEAHTGEEARSAALFFIGGFALFTLLSVLVG